MIAGSLLVIVFPLFLKSSHTERERAHNKRIKKRNQRNAEKQYNELGIKPD